MITKPRQLYNSKVLIHSEYLFIITQKEEQNIISEQIVDCFMILTKTSLKPTSSKCSSFVMDIIFVMFGGHVFKQTVDIPMSDSRHSYVYWVCISSRRLVHLLVGNGLHNKNYDF